MGIGLVVERRFGGNEKIPIEDWRQFVSECGCLRIRTEPYIAINPVTGRQIVLKLGEADSELLIGGEWMPFLRYRNGKLVTEYQDEFLDPLNEMRLQIVQVAQRFNAVVCTDVSDDDLAW